MLLIDNLTCRLNRAANKGDLAEVSNLISSHAFSFSQIKNGGYGFLKHSIHNGHVEVAKLLLQKGVSVNYHDYDKANTPLHLATQNRNAELVEMLINKNAFIDARNCYGKTSLHMATEIGDKNIVKLLLDSGADCGLKDSSDMEPLHIACREGRYQIIELLLHFRTQNKYSNPQSLNLALLVASKYGFEKTITYLLNAGADPNATIEPNLTNLKGFEEYLGINPLHLACEKRYEGSMDLLLKHGADVNCSRVKDGYKPLHIASQGGREKIACFLLKNGADPDAEADGNVTPLHLAAKTSYFKIVEALVSSAANVNAQTCKGFTPLHLVCDGYCSSNASVEVIRCLLSHGADPNIKANDSVTPLHLAVKCRNSTEIQLLLSNGANVNAQTCKGFTPLHMAADGSSFGVEGANLLLKIGADPNIKADGDVTPLHVAVKEGNLKTVKALLNSGANVNLQTTERSTPLLLATERRKEAVAKILLEQGACVNTADKKSNTPFYFAVESRSWSLIGCILQYKPYINDETKKSILRSIACSTKYHPVVNYLIEYGFVIDEEDMRDCNLLPAAVVKGYTKIVECILNNGADLNNAKYGSTLLHRAVENKHEEITKLLLGSGCDTNTKDEKGNTPICYTFNCKKENECMEIIQLLLAYGADVKKAPKVLHKAINKKFTKVCKILIENSADINALDGFTKTPLHLAAGKGMKEVVHTLLDFGVDVNSRAVDESTALHFACENGHKELVDYLCCKGANVNAQSKNGSTALHLACQHGHKEIVKYLCNKEANVNAQSKDGSTALHLACEFGHTEIAVYLCGKEANMNAQKENGFTPLHYASRQGLIETVEILLNNKANANVHTLKDCLRPLHLAAYAGFVGVVKMLLDFGAEIDAQDLQNETALHLAVSKGQSAVVKFLLENGCDINLENNYHETAFDLAISKAEDYNYWSAPHLISEMLTKHIIQLKVSGLFLNRKLLHLFSKLFGKFYEDCKEEVQRMKNEKICCHLTLHDILVRRSNPTFARNESIRQILKSFDYSEFPIFKNLIMISFKTSKKRNELLASGQKSLDFLVKTSNVLNEIKLPILPSEILENIVPYLNTNDLKSLIFFGESLKKQITK